MKNKIATELAETELNLQLGWLSAFFAGKIIFTEPSAKCFWCTYKEYMEKALARVR